MIEKKDAEIVDWRKETKNKSETMSESCSVVIKVAKLCNLACMSGNSALICILAFYIYKGIYRIICEQCSRNNKESFACVHRII